MLAAHHARAAAVLLTCRWESRRRRARTGAAICRSKSKKYTEVMKEKMQWDPDAPYDYVFERGLYYHHILDNELLCGSQPTTADDIHYLKEAENVDVIISVCSQFHALSAVAYSRNGPARLPQHARSCAHSFIIVSIV